MIWSSEQHFKMQENKRLMEEHSIELSIKESAARNAQLKDILISMQEKKHIFIRGSFTGSFEVLATDYNPSAVAPHMIAPTVIPPAIHNDTKIEGTLIYSDKNTPRISITPIST